MSPSVFSGLTVLEFGASSSPAMLAGVLLADNGARVVKVESPSGDQARESNPSQFLVLNRGKESLVADLHSAEGVATALEWAANADVVIEGFGPGVADRFGIGYEALSAINPALVYCSIKGFGSTGAYARIPGYEHVVQAKAGFFSLGTGGVFGYRPGPIYVNAPMGSTGAGFNAAAGIAAALYVREQTGRGQHLETTLLQGLDPTDYFGTALWQWENETFPAQKQVATNSAGSAPAEKPGGIAASRYSYMPCTKDGRWVYFTAMLPHQAQAVLRALGISDLLKDERFANAPYFGSADDAQGFEDAIWEAFRTRTFEEWDPVLSAEKDVAYELSRTSEEGLDHPQTLHNGEVITLESPDHGRIQQVGPFARFSQTPASVTRSAPRLAEHGELPRAPRGHVADAPAPPHPLAGVTIVEFGYFYAMPYGMTLAASLGARVIKIEDRNGDPMRKSFGPPEVGAMKTMLGKESISVDLRTEEGREVVRRLIGQADVFVNGFRPGVAERQGLDFKSLKALNPDIVYLHASGYGEDGPSSQRPIYAQCASAVAGSLYRQATTWLDPTMTEGLAVSELQAVIAPRLRGQTDGDSNAALGAFTALCFALYARKRHGTSQSVATSMVGANLWAYADDAVRYEGKPALRATDPEFYGLDALYRTYETKDGWSFLAAPTQGEWDSLTSTLGLDDLAADPRFATTESRAEHDEALTTALEAVFASHEAAHLEDKLVDTGVACVKVFEGSYSAFTNTDPVLRETGLVRDVEHPLYGTTLRAAEPVFFSETPGRIETGPLLGGQSAAILRELGYDESRISALFDSGAVYAEAPS